MKTRFIAVAVALCLLLIASGCTAQDQRGKTRELKTLTDRVSYGIGLNIGKDFKEQHIDVNPDLLAQGIRDAMNGGEVLMTEEEMQQAMMEFQQEMMAAQEKRMTEQASKNLQEGQAFLATNANKEGVVVLPSGLQYRVIEEGKGKSPTAQSMVTVHYRGRLIDGTEFDSSYERGEPATFPVAGVIPGWTEALQLMQEGAKWELFIPAELAYGERGAGQVIGPNSVLIFEVELLSVK
jgi:FKBP-type peptidyl-prolyl cis-trans isomerase FklB